MRQSHYLVRVKSSKVSPFDGKIFYGDFQTLQLSSTWNRDGFLVGEVALTDARSVNWGCRPQISIYLIYDFLEKTTNIYKKLFSQDVQLTKITSKT